MTNTENTEALETRRDGGRHCDVWSGPCACGANHHPGDGYKPLDNERPSQVPQEN